MPPEEVMDIVTVLDSYANEEGKQNKLFASELARRASHEIASLRALAREARKASSNNNQGVNELLRAMLDEGFRKTFRPNPGHTPSLEHA